MKAVSGVFGSRSDAEHAIAEMKSTGLPTASWRICAGGDTSRSRGQAWREFTKQAIAIGLSKARRAGVKLQAPNKGKVFAKTSKQAKRDYRKGQSHSAQNALIETLKWLNPSFAGANENEAVSIERGAEQVDNERLLELIDAQIHSLQ